MTLQCIIPQQHHRHVMGAKGSNVQEITKQYNVNIKFPERPRQDRGDSSTQPQVLLSCLYTGLLLMTVLQLQFPTAPSTLLFHIFVFTKCSYMYLFINHSMFRRTDIILLYHLSYMSSMRDIVTVSCRLRMRPQLPLTATAPLLLPETPATRPPSRLLRTSSS